MYCPNCGQKLVSSDCRHTNIDEISYGGVNRDQSLIICRCDACGKVSGVIPDIEIEEE
jgi:uncharacterized Zn finger protein